MYIGIISCPHTATWYLVSRERVFTLAATSIQRVIGKLSAFEKRTLLVAGNKSENEARLLSKTYKLTALEDSQDFYRPTCEEATISRKIQIGIMSTVDARFP